MNCIYSSDLHGNPWIYEKLFRIASRPETGAILLGGDLSPLTPPLERMIERQREFWSDFLRPRCRELVRAGKRVLLIPGNDDLRVHDELLRRGREEGAWEVVDGASTTLGGFTVVGCGMISLSPFVLKDREAYDVEAGRWPEPDVIDLADAANTIFSAGRSPDDLRRTLLERLEALFAGVPTDRPTILMAHCPPRGTAIDVLYDGRHVGSEAVRRVIEKQRPVLGLHGHIHESPSMPGGSWRDRIGETIVVNPGSRHHDGEGAPLNLISFDVADIAATIGLRRF